MTPEEQQAADDAAAQERQDEEAKLKAQEEAKAKADKAKVKPEKSAKLKKTIGDLKSTDTVVVSFKNPTHAIEDDENTVKKEEVVQHVKYEYWLSLPKDKNGAPKYSTVRGAKLIGYVEDGEVIKF
jgi:hypothetical protein